MDPKLTFSCVSYYLGAFGTVWLPYETLCKTGKTSAKVRATKSRWNFSERLHPIHPMDPKLTFWCVSYYFGAFRNVWLRYETRCKTSRTSAKLRATKSRQNFSQQTQPIRPHWTLYSCFCAFRTIWEHLGPFGCLTEFGANRAKLV